MNIALRTRRMTRKDFFKWAEGREGRHEFDGFAPVAMVGNTANHGQIAGNLHACLRSRSRGGPCRAFTAFMGGGTICSDGVIP